ncbi:hydroxyacid dehydrogenase [Salmonella enterica]|uniref:D-3-phosphoglycerate dehydrogenase n=2 Tax=Salmonella enterica TaxID=28901 RepID=A0A379QIK5_SALER|nr:hydroxyacid dehydrogenase [Salmonella enterica]ECC1480899.1 hydroxyacid dehydrogenase [Salmonella enterica subsp. salamae]HCM1914901.1 hydroxyacid dehydrogenase [Salmonella enterica subsp. salamae serovar 28:r:e,n,z15]ASG86320.1 hydroxyacid dehydrogenase [Salmonella enterica subsp. salamae serovar 55:k:z39 str. 1315K]ECC1654449.1 hydroxyacid dehydrogenase [Salmonella enterica subsp. salamae]ECD9412896.1 hydroxyacid dehydrogenase [Salmonella enterica subsp. salamae]
MTYKILLPQEIMSEGREYLESRGYELINGSGMEEEDIIRDIPDCDGIIVRLSKMSDRVFAAAKKLKVVARHGAGYDTVDLESAKRHGVIVLNAPIANSMSVAELTFFYMLHCSRNFKLVEEKMLEDYYWAKLRTPKVELDGKTIGLIGVGNIGSRVALKALHGFNMKVIAYDPYKTQQQVPQGVQLTDDFERIFKESDFVSLHCPTTAETSGFVGEKEFSMMKPTAYFINTARGKLVNEKALYHALTSNTIAGAGIDVLQKEPFDPNDPIFKLSNIVIGPHIGAATIEATDRASLHSAIGIDEVLSGKKPSWPVPGFEGDK